MERKSRKLAFLIALLLIMCTLLEPATVKAAAVLKYGSRGDDVVNLQSRLKRWSYYFGSIDGIFGSQTKEAVMYFQRRNGLAVDGMVGPQTAKSLGMTLSSSTSSSGGSSSNASGDLYLLARVVYGEARGEPYKGQVAVAAIVLNRVKSSSFPNSLSGVVYQSGAFSIVADGQINLAPNQTAINAARDAMNGWDPTNGCIYYFNPAKTSNQWMHSRPKVVTIGSHVFCK